MRNISAVHGPMPRTCTSRAFSSSSDSESTSASGTVPSATLRARSVMAASFGPLTPAARMDPGGRARTAAGSRPSANSFMNRPRIAVAAAPASCWYMIDRTSAPKPSESEVSSFILPVRLMSLASAGSFSATSRVPFAICCGVAWRALGKLAHELRELVARETQVFLAQILQRPRGEMLGGHEVVHLRVHVEQARDEVALRPALLDDPQRRPAVSRIVVFAELLQHDV